MAAKSVYEAAGEIRFGMIRNFLISVVAGHLSGAMLRQDSRLSEMLTDDQMAEVTGVEEITIEDLKNTSDIRIARMVASILPNGVGAEIANAENVAQQILIGNEGKVKRLADFLIRERRIEKDQLVELLSNAVVAEEEGLFTAVS